MNILIDLLITLFVYLTFPIFYRCRYGKVEKKRASKISLWNSIIGAFVFVLIRAAMGALNPVSSFAPAVLYFYINRAILTDKSSNLPENKNE